MALNLIAEVMGWEEGETSPANREYAWLKMMSSIKYDGYADFRAGVRFIESLAVWLKQFDKADRPTAYDGYFCTNDIIAYGFIRALREHGLKIPDDVSIIGFDNLPQSATMDPGLTTIEVSKRKIGYLAVTILDDLIHSADPQPAVKILVGADLVLRGSHEKLVQRTNNRAQKLEQPAE